MGAAPVGQALIDKFKEKAPECVFREGERGGNSVMFLRKFIAQKLFAQFCALLLFSRIKFIFRVHVQGKGGEAHFYLCCSSFAQKCLIFLATLLRKTFCIFKASV